MSVESYDDYLQAKRQEEMSRDFWAREDRLDEEAQERRAAFKRGEIPHDE